MKIERSNIESVQESSFNNPEMTLEKWLTLSDTEKFDEIKQVEGININNIPQGWDFLGGGCDKFVKGKVLDYNAFLKQSLLPRIQKEISLGGTVIAARPSEVFSGMDPKNLDDAYIFLKKINKGSVRGSKGEAILSRKIRKETEEGKQGAVVSKLLSVDKKERRVGTFTPTPLEEKIPQSVDEEIVPERQIPKAISPAVEDKKNDNEIKINTLKQEIIEKTLSPEEKKYYEDHAYLAVKDIQSIESSLKLKQDYLDRANKKGFWGKDKKEIQKLEDDIADLNIQLNTKKQFSEKQKEFLKNNPSIHLEGKTEQEVEQMILNHPQVFTMLMGTYRGLDIQKVIYKGKELSNAKNYLDLIPRDMRNEYGSLFRNAGYYEAFPGHMDFLQGKGFGILFKNKDYVNRDGFSGMWAVIPDYEKNLADYLNLHPEVILNIFKKNFISGSSGNALHNEGEVQSGKSVYNINLVSKKFLDLNE